MGADHQRTSFEPLVTHCGTVVTVEKQQEEFDDWKRDVH